MVRVKLYFKSKSKSIIIQLQSKLYWKILSKSNSIQWTFSISITSPRPGNMNLWWMAKVILIKWIRIELLDLFSALILIWRSIEPKFELGIWKLGIYERFGEKWRVQALAPKQIHIHSQRIYEESFLITRILCNEQFSQFISLIFQIRHTKRVNRKT